MTEEELAEALAGALRRAPAGRKTDTYVLFGIMYADYLEGTSTMKRVVDLCRQGWGDTDQADIPSESAWTDIRYGQRIARYVEFQQGIPPPWM